MMWYVPTEIAETEATLSLGQAGMLFMLILLGLYLLARY